jgi:hypothetical protein
MKSELVWLGLGAVGLYFAYTNGLLGMFRLCPSGMSVSGGVPFSTCVTDLSASQLAALVKKVDPSTVGNPPVPNTLIDKISVTNAPPNFSAQTFGMSGTRNYIRRGTPMRTR